MNSIGRIATMIVIAAIIAVIVTKNGKGAAMISDAGRAFSTIIKQVVSPVNRQM